LLDTVLRETPRPADVPEAHLHLLFRPVVSDSGLRERVVPAEDVERRLRNLILQVTNRFRFANPWSPELSYVANGSVSRVVDGYALMATAAKSARHTELHVSDDGEVRVFSSGAADLRSSDMTNDLKQFTLRDGTLAHFSVQAAALSGQLLAEGGYLGPVDGACAVIGARHASSALIHDVMADFELGLKERPPCRIPYRRSGRWPAALLHDDPTSIAQHLIGPFLHAARQGRTAELFALR